MRHRPNTRFPPELAPGSGARRSWRSTTLELQADDIIAPVQNRPATPNTGIGTSACLTSFMTAPGPPTSPDLGWDHGGRGASLPGATLLAVAASECDR
jgi:hypothetical protein